MFARTALACASSPRPPPPRAFRGASWRGFRAPPPARAMSPDKDWESMWSAGGGLKPGEAFDANRCEPSLQALIDAGALPSGRALVPGCGRGYAVAALVSATRHVTGLEISATAKAAADAHLASAGLSAGDRATVLVDDSSRTTRVPVRPRLRQHVPARDPRAARGVGGDVREAHPPGRRARLQRLPDRRLRGRAAVRAHPGDGGAPPRPARVPRRSPRRPPNTCGRADDRSFSTGSRGNPTSDMR